MYSFRQALWCWNTLNHKYKIYDYMTSTPLDQSLGTDDGTQWMGSYVLFEYNKWVPPLRRIIPTMSGRMCSFPNTESNVQWHSRKIIIVNQTPPNF